MVINRKLKIIIDVLLTVLFCTSFCILFGMAISIHMITAMSTAVLSLFHIWINKNRLLVIFKTQARGKLNKKARWRCTVSLFLVIAWIVCITSGILLGFPAIFNSLPGTTDIFYILVVHIFTAFLCLILAAVHIAQHIGYIKAFISSRARGNRTSKTRGRFICLTVSYSSANTTSLKRRGLRSPDPQASECKSSSKS